MASRITFTPVVYSQYRRQDGSYSIRMRITCNRKSKFITTSEIALPSQLTRSLAIKDAALIQRLRKLEERMRAAISDLDMYTLSLMSLDEIVSYMQKRINGDFRLDFLAFWLEAIQDKSEGSRANYTYAQHNFKSFVGTDTLDISKVTSNLMRQYEAWLVGRYGKGARAVTMYTAAVKHIHGLARKKYNNDEVGEVLIRNPFEFYIPPKQKPTLHRDVGLKVIQDMIDTRKDIKGKRERRAVDTYLLSFALMGMNSPDLFSCSTPEKGVIIYNRQKTRDRRADKAEMHVKIDKRIMPLFKEYAESNGNQAFIFHRIFKDYKQMNSSLAQGLKQYRSRKGIPDGELDFYSARHSWATLAYSAGIDKSIINDCLCHVDKDMKVTDIYINKDWSVLWAANSKVLDLFRWKLKHKPTSR